MMKEKGMDVEDFSPIWCDGGDLNNLLAWCDMTGSLFSSDSRRVFFYEVMICDNCVFIERVEHKLFKVLFILKVGEGIGVKKVPI